MLSGIYLWFFYEYQTWCCRLWPWYLAMSVSRNIRGRSYPPSVEAVAIPRVCFCYARSDLFRWRPPVLASHVIPTLLSKRVQKDGALWSPSSTTLHQSYVAAMPVQPIPFTRSFIMSTNIIKHLMLLGNEISSISETCEPLKYTFVFGHHKQNHSPPLTNNEKRELSSLISHISQNITRHLWMS